MNTLEYRGYRGRVEIDFESHSLYGRIEGIPDFVNFESDTVSGVEEEFHNAVDDYISFCEEMKGPQTPALEAFEA